MFQNARSKLFSIGLVLGYAVTCGVAHGADRNNTSAVALSPLSNITLLNSPETIEPARLHNVDLRGWNHIADKFEAAGVDRLSIIKVFTDSRVPQRTDLFFSLQPRESAYNYRKLNTQRNRDHALRCYFGHKEYFDGASKEFGVPASVILSILQVETACGANTGSSRVLPGLLRLAAAATPENIEVNITKRSDESDLANVREKVEARAKWLEDTFLPHAIATLRLAKWRKLDPLDIEGSGAGALGMPQFLPGHYLRYGVDGDRDGDIDLFNAADAIYSVGLYLKSYGWKSTEMTRADKREVIFQYNRSEPYVETVLGMAQLLEKPMKQKPQAIPTRLQLIRRQR